MKQLLKGAGFVAVSYAAGAVLFVGYVLLSIALEQREIANRTYN